MEKRGSLYNDKGSVYQEDITVINIYAPNIKALKYIEQIQTDLKGGTDKYSNSRGLQSPTINNGYVIQTENSKEMRGLAHTLDQIDIIDIQNIPSKSKRKHILLKGTWKILQGRLYDRSQNKSANLRRLKSYQVSFPTTVE